MKMTANHLKVVHEPVEIEIEEITLLTAEEYVDAKDVILHRYESWWLRSPGLCRGRVAYVGIDGGLYDRNVANYENLYVRPVLKVKDLESSGLEISDRFEIASRLCSVISPRLILFDDFVGKTAFRKDVNAKDANDYEQSDVKKWLEKWAKEAGLT